MYPEPQNLYEEYQSNPEGFESLSDVEEPLNTFVFRHPHEASYKFDFIKPQEPVVQPLTSRYVSHQGIPKESPRDTAKIGFALRYIFFAEEPLVAFFRPPAKHPEKHMKTGKVLPESYDIGKSFREFQLVMELKNTQGILTFDKDEPMFYLELGTKRDVIFKRFEFSEKLAGYRSHYETFFPRDTKQADRDNQFMDTRTNELVLNEIKKNLLD